MLALAGSDAASGAGIQASRIHAAMLRRGVESRLLVKEKTGDGEFVEGLRRTRLGRWALFHRQRWERRSGYHLMLHPSSPGSPFAERIASADLLHLHDVHSRFVHPAAIVRWTKRVPVVWTLQDMWAVTGKCIYAYDCDRWMRGCGRCPQLAEWPVLDKDRTDFLWRWKRHLFSNARLRLVAPSRWLAEIVGRSPLLGHLPVEVIPNSVDVRTFRPGPKDESRRALGIAPGAFVVAFGSHASVPRKGFSHLLEATKKRRSRGEWTVLAMGEPLAGAANEPGIVWAGAVTAGEEMARHLRAADVLCLPTLAENLALVLLEAAATGIASVAFDSGGTREAVADGETGILAPPGDTSRLREAIESLARDVPRRVSMGAAARLRAEREFDDDLVAARYEAVYREIAYRR